MYSQIVSQVLPSFVSGAAVASLAWLPVILRGARAESELKALKNHFDRAIEDAKARGRYEGKDLTEKEFWDAFKRELFADLEATQTFPLRKRTVITVKERITWRACTVGGWETLTTITMMREIASAADLAAYLKELVAPLIIPIATKVMLAGAVL
jgi:hypothetical protein